MKENNKNKVDIIDENSNQGIEILSKRGKREKHFLRKDGSILAQMYTDDIHFKKNGKYEEIDNRLEKIGNYYKTKNNFFNAYFNENSVDKYFGYELSQGNLSFELLNGNDVPIKLIDGESQFTQKIKYEDIFDGIDFEYCIMSSKIKENIIIKDRKSLVNEICFKVNTNFDLNSNEQGNIDVSKDGNVLFNLEAPYMIDSNHLINSNVKYHLTKNTEGYILKLLLDVEWLNSQDTIFPVIIDPTISTYNKGNVYDTYIYPDDTNINRNGQDILKAGVEKVNNKDVINRSLIKFELPTIGTGSQVYEAYLHLISYSMYSITDPFEIKRFVDVHRVTTDWTENGANWNSMHDKFDERIECSFACSRSWEEYSWEGNVMTTHIIPYSSVANITSLVQKWYTGTPNYGVMLRAHKEVYDSKMLPAFYSNNNTINGDNPKPSLEIIYRNQNGLESYMNYQSQSFNNGVVYENTYNGNLVTSFEIGSITEGKTPISLGLIYNTNDVVLNNDVGLGTGYKFSLWQTIKPDSEIASDTKYLQYVDEDGTIHYFYEEAGIYKDEDNLNMEIEVHDTNYILRDKYDNYMKFSKIDNIGYLTEIKDVRGNAINIKYNSNNLIEQIITADNQMINIVYETNKILVTSPRQAVTLNYTDDKIDNISTLEGDTYFEYNVNNLISRIIDVDGTSVGYNYYEQKPYRIKKVTEYGINNHEGASFTMDYGHKTTTIIDDKNRTTVISFNNHANPVCTSNLKNKDDISNAYGTDYYYGEWEEYKNKLLSNKIPVKYVNNHLKNTSFENENILFSTSEDVKLTISNDYAYSGHSSLKAVSTEDNKFITQNVNVAKGDNYTFSAYIRNNNIVKLVLSYIDSNNQTIEQEGELIASNDEFNRYDVTINYPVDAVSELCIKIYLMTSGIVYIDDVQLEEGEVANHYNYIENSDFSDGLGELDYFSGDNDLNRFEVVTLSDGKSKALKIKMDPEYDTYVSKEFKISGHAGDEYNISFWYKNKGIIPEDDGIKGSATWLRVFYSDPDDWHVQHCIPRRYLNPSEDEWQYFSGSYITEADYDSFMLHFGQSGDANELYITNLSLFKSVGSSDYDYDKNGNITSITGTNKEINKFEYNSNNQLVTAINPKGKKLMYEYDNQMVDRLINSISEMGICNETKYDANDNCVTNRINKKGITGVISNDLYRIRMKGTDSYIRNIMNVVELKDYCGYHDLWNLEKVDDCYKISHSIVPNKYFTIQNDKLILSPFNGDNSLFMLIENNNGSYSLNLKGTAKYIKNDNNTLIATSYISEDPNFEFYFEPKDEEKFMETNYEYTEDGKFIKSVVDTNLNKIVYDIDPVTGLTRSTINPKKQTASYEYDDEHRLTSIKVNNDRQVSYTYNEHNLLDKIIYGTKEYNFEYDDFMNNKSLKIGDDIVIITNNYEEKNGNLLLTKYGNNHSISYEYDEFDRTKTINTMDNVYHFKYGNNGDLLKVVSNDNVIKFSYDLGKRLTEYRTENFRFKFKYDINSNITKKEYRLGNISQKIDNVFNDDNVLTKMQFDNHEINYTFDKLGRFSSNNVDNIITTHYEYITNGKRTSTLIGKSSYNNDNYSYRYDKMNNLTHIYHNNVLENKYYYNHYNELLKEDNYLINKTIVYSYDECGNLLFKKEYELGTDNMVNEYIYQYNNSNWEDQLTCFDNQIITYDETGNPLTIGDNVSLQWINGKQLLSYNDLNNDISYKYDYTNARTEKTVNGITTKYYLEGTKIIFEEIDNNVIYYIYDGNNGLVGFKYNNDLYYYVKNYQNDIVAILDSEGIEVARYQYDSWGNHISIKDFSDNEITDASHIGLINPFRYRSYYFDNETGLYYLNSRYYNPLWGRFLNADSTLIQSSSLTGYNLFAYADNNPINSADSNGNFPLPLAILVVGALCLVCTGSSKKSKNQKKKNNKSSGSNKQNQNNNSTNSSVTTKKALSGSKVKSQIVGALPTLGGMVIADGPSLVGDAIAVVSLIGLTLYAFSTAVIDMVTDDSTTVADKNVRPCTAAKFTNGKKDVRRLGRLTVEESASYIEMGGHVMCDDHDSAYKVALKFDEHTDCEIDKNQKPGYKYYYHYHPDRNSHRHIWFLGLPPKKIK